MLAMRLGALIRAYAVEVSGRSGQTSYVATKRIANIEVLITAYEVSERAVGRHIQTITSRARRTAPVCNEVVVRHACSRICSRRWYSIVVNDSYGCRAWAA